MSRRLSDTEVASRMVELRNLRRLHLHDRQQISQLKAENRTLRAENQLLKSQVATLQIQIAELQAMVFGRKKRPPAGTVVPALPTILPKLPRTADSYRRPVPPATAVTSEVTVPLPETCACGRAFDPSRITRHVRYAEDVPLPELTPGYQPHLVTKYVIAKSLCRGCGRTTVGDDFDLGGAEVSLGPNVRLLVCHLVAVAGMSYSQVADLLLTLYGLHVSDGEIAAVLAGQHQHWQPAYNQLKADIRAAPVTHIDETPWPIRELQGHGYAWSMSDSGSEAVVFALENSRGAQHARELYGDGSGVYVTDGYAPYRNLPGDQQLCWAHPYRAIRDLRYNDNLPAGQLTAVSWWYEQFAGIYQDVRMYLSEPYDAVVRETQAEELWRQVKDLASKPPDCTAGQPKKLTNLKNQLLRAGKDRLLVCLTADAPCDNNRAERDLRQLVLKRKRSFGSKTEKGAKALATILSLCTTAWRRAKASGKPQDYFTALASLAG